MVGHPPLWLASLVVPEAFPGPLQELLECPLLQHPWLLRAVLHLASVLQAVWQHLPLLLLAVVHPLKHLVTEQILLVVARLRYLKEKGSRTSNTTSSE